MLEKLARWLRIIGYDVIFNPKMELIELIQIANYQNRIFVTRRRYLPMDVTINNLYKLMSENFEEQFRDVVEKFGLDIKSGIFTRCTDCNEIVVKVEKESVKDRVPEMSWQGFQEFYECPKCKKVFWKGAHYKNTIRKLEKIMR
ncbi:MAG: hypothetical protein IGBAC_0791 [Ignavibacteriae bacterium]|nr:MAG: hypothetical protein IGBAC_0791 [Ignavibacteriota bacterium]